MRANPTRTDPSRKPSLTAHRTPRAFTRRGYSTRNPISANRSEIWKMLTCKTRLSAQQSPRILPNRPHKPPAKPLRFTSRHLRTRRSIGCLISYRTTHHRSPQSGLPRFLVGKHVSNSLPILCPWSISSTSAWCNSRLAAIANSPSAITINLFNPRFLRLPACC